MDEPPSGAERRALERILSTPQLAQLVPHLQPEILHRVIAACGLDACGDVLALATPSQLRQLCDIDLWRAPAAGHDETFDASRFAEWLEVLVDTSPAGAAEKLAQLDRDLVTAGLATHVRVLDISATAEYVTTDGDLVAPRRADDSLAVELDGFLVIGRRTDAWDAVVAALTALDTERPDAFASIMRAVCGLSNSTPERDGLDSLLDAGDQAMHDARVGRESRRERQGYIAAGDARAFLQASRNVHADRAPVAHAGVIAPHPIVPGRSAQAGVECDVTAVMTLLMDAGIVEAPRALIGGASQPPSRVKRLHDQMQWLVDRDPVAYAARNADLAALSNALLAGCALQGRAFSTEEAWDAAVATCNLALERLQAPGGYLAEHDLIRVFQIGWTLLHDDVVMCAADELAAAIVRLRWDDPLVQADVDVLRGELIRQLRTGTPWRARRRMDVLASLDPLAWAALLGLIAECPVRHAAIGAARVGTTRVDASAFEFIATTATITEIHGFLKTLPQAFGDTSRR